MSLETGEPTRDQQSLERLRHDRRTIHQNPEMGLDLPLTTALVDGVLADLSCTVSHPLDSCVCAFFDFGRPSSVAFRADMDALPVSEATGLPFASEVPGVMHACGHDGHTAILLELARRLSSMAEQPEDGFPPQNVLLIFQPGEEHPGGARLVCESGVLGEARVTRIFGLHLWPELGSGVLATRPGPFLARSSECDVTIRGIAAHAAHRDQGADALMTAAMIVRGARSIEDAEHEIGRDCVINFGHMEAGTVRNAVASEARIEGTVRTFERDSFERVTSRIGKLVAHAQEAEPGVVAEVAFDEGYPAVINDPATTERLLAAGIGIERLAEPSMISDDFSSYLEHVCGTYLFLGTGTPSRRLHAADFDFDESVLLSGVSAFETIAGMAWDEGARS